MVGCVVQTAFDTGVEGVVVVVGYAREQIEGYVNAAFQDADVAFALQAEQLGTAHAVQQALPALEGFEGDVIILYGDVPNLAATTLQDLVALHREHDAILSMISTRVEDPTGYGRVIRDADNRALRIVEHRDCDPVQRAVNEINVGVYVVNNAFLQNHLGRIDASNAQSEFYLTDLVELARADRPVQVLDVADALELQGVNDRSHLAMAETWARQTRNTILMRQGVTMRHPETTTVEFGVVLEPDVVLGSHVHLAGTTHIGAGARIGQGCVICDTKIGEKAALGPYVVATEITIDAGAHIAAQSVLGTS